MNLRILFISLTFLAFSCNENVQNSEQGSHTSSQSESPAEIPGVSLSTSNIIGNTIDVTVHVNKGDIQGMSKLQLDLPVGLEASKIETQGATFMNTDSTVKFIWMSLPATNYFAVSFKIQSKNELLKIELGGVFYFLDKNNNKQKVEIENRQMLIEPNS